MRPEPRVLIMADIEGSSGCFDRECAQWLNRKWLQACRDMTLDVAAVAGALQQAGVGRMTIVDFHRTGFNLWPDLLPRGIRLCQGYRPGPVPGIGSPPSADVAMFLGMHAASGPEGFLPHTLTSRFAEITVNGRPLAEIELFAGALGPYGIRPVFFSGCAVACDQAVVRVPGIGVWPVPAKPLTSADKGAWRRGLAAAAVAGLDREVKPFCPTGPFVTRIRFRPGPDGLPTRPDLTFTEATFSGLYWRLLFLAYVPLPIKRLPALALRLHAIYGRAGLELSRALLSH